MIPKRKAQAAIEYLLIIALTLGIIVPMTYLFFNYSSESATELVDSRVAQIGKTMIDTAESVYFSGESSKISLELSMPDNVDSIYIIDEKELVFNVTTPLGENEVVFFSSVNITSQSCANNFCYLNDFTGFGQKKIQFQSVSDGKKVLISAP